MVAGGCRDPAELAGREASAQRGLSDGPECVEGDDGRTSTGSSSISTTRTRWALLLVRAVRVVLFGVGLGEAPSRRLSPPRWQARVSSKVRSSSAGSMPPSSATTRAAQPASVIWVRLRSISLSLVSKAKGQHTSQSAAAAPRELVR